MSDGTDKELAEPEVLPPDPGAFGPGSHTPAIEAPILSLKDRLKQSPESQRVSGEIQGIKRAPGRPRGSRNKPKEEANVGPSIQEIQRERRAKRERADQIAEQITGEFNDTIMRFLVAQGMPPAVIYNDGYVPRPISKNSAKYTDIGAKLAVDEFTAGMVANFIVEFESSDTGQRIVGATTSGPVGLVVKGLVAGACAVGYLNGVKKVVDTLQPLIEAQKQYKRQQQANRQAEQRPIRPEGAADGLG